MKSFRIAVYPGDGIGPEVIDQALRVLERVQLLEGKFAVEATRFPWGCDFFERNGKFVPDDYLAMLAEFDAILLGAIGDPRRVSDALSLRPLIQLRQRFDQYACVRPARLVRGVQPVLARGQSIDMIVVRENSEGEYLPCGGRVRPGEVDEIAIQTAVHSRKGVERILRYGFELARSRRKRLTMITKSNALPYGFVMWEEVLAELRGQYLDVEADRQHVDAAAMNFVRRPEIFDVIVSSNLFGDILSDLGGAIVGGLGLLPSANLNPERKYPSMFEPVHGSAPDIAGQRIANPVAAILSAAMMLDWLSQPTAAKRIRDAVDRAISDGATTPDLGGALNTVEMGDSVLERVE